MAAGLPPGGNIAAAVVGALEQSIVVGRRRSLCRSIHTAPASWQRQQESGGVGDNPNAEQAPRGRPFTSEELRPTHEHSKPQQVVEKVMHSAPVEAVKSVVQGTAEFIGKVGSDAAAHAQHALAEGVSVAAIKVEDTLARAAHEVKHVQEEVKHIKEDPKVPVRPVADRVEGALRDTIKKGQQGNSPAERT